MLKDRYGNYVIQKCIEVSKGKQKEVLLKKIRDCANVLRKQQNYSRHVYNFIEKLGDGSLGVSAVGLNVNNEHSHSNGNNCTLGSSKDM